MKTLDDRLAAWRRETEGLKASDELKARVAGKTGASVSGGLSLGTKVMLVLAVLIIGVGALLLSRQQSTVEPAAVVAPSELGAPKPLEPSAAPALVPAAVPSVPAVLAPAVHGQETPGVSPVVPSRKPAR